MRLSKEAKAVKYRYALGGVPGTSMDQDGFSYISLLYLSASENRGMLTFVFLLRDGRMVAQSDFYFMRRTSDGWSASNGNGGPGMYAKVESFVTRLNHQPAYWVGVELEPAETCLSEQEWEKEQGIRAPGQGSQVPDLEHHDRL